MRMREPDMVTVPSPHPVPTGEDLPDGFHLVWEEETRDDWQFPVPESESRWRRCRGAKGCPGPVVASLERGNGPWFYCEHHLYGRRIEDGKLIAWRWAKDDTRERV